ncbi:LIV-I protein H [Raoultella planticola]|uniref:LIV-I protein H n=1 Tax=Raoultella planticola TaxID=575 RepID=A0A485CWU8_RAOPL|nr:LIV-I protein H [Raoultella planticola]
MIKANITSSNRQNFPPLHKGLFAKRQRRCARLFAARLPAGWCLWEAFFLQQLINGLTLGAVYGLIAIGYTMVYGIIGMINFAHGRGVHDFRLSVRYRAGVALPDLGFTPFLC